VQFADDLQACGFATGATHYSDHLPGRVSVPQIVLTIRLAGTFTTDAIVDTGSTWCIFSPDIVALFEPMIEDTYAPQLPLVIRGNSYRGRLVRVSVRLPAEVGADLDIEATAFVPSLGPGEVWNVPNFVGLEGLLHRVRFAVNPIENVLYFAQA
jgi:hypothetical protein